MCFDVENECISKKFQECHTGDFFRTQKESIFWDFFLDIIFQEYFKCQKLLDVFYK
jgi:hypothetical protein